MASRRQVPRLPKKTKVGYRQQALDLLGVTEADILAVAKIEPLLKKAGVLDRVWKYLEVSTHPTAQKLIAQKFKLTNASQRKTVPLEAYCLAAGIRIEEALGMIVAEVYSQNEQAALLMAASAQPEVVSATIDAAKRPGGTREREMLHKHSGFVPVPKTSVTVIRGNANVIGTQNNQQVAVLPPIEQHVRQVGDRFNERLLGSSDDSVPVYSDEGDEGGSSDV